MARATSSMSFRARLRIALPLAACLALLGLQAFPAEAGARGLYVVNRDTASVSVIDSRTNTPVGAPIELGVGTDPESVAISPDGTRAYVASDAADAVFVIDTRSNRVVAPPISVQSPAAIAVAPDGKTAYVVEEDVDAEIFSIDTATNQVIGPPIEVEGIPRDLAVTPDGRSIYVVGDRVNVVDVGSGAVVRRVAVGVAPEGVVISPDGTRAYVVNFSSRDVSVIDTRTNELIGAPIPVGIGPERLAISPNGRNVYVSNLEADSVSVIDTGTNRVAATIPVGDRPMGIAVSPNGKTAYVANQDAKTVSVIDTATNQVIGAPIPVGDEPDGLAIIPNQPPLSTFSGMAARIRPGVPTGFDATASRDAHGAIASFNWALPGAPPFAAGPSVAHTFPRPGTYGVTLTLTDDEGCSTALVFTGKTAHCNGSAVSRPRPWRSKSPTRASASGARPRADSRRCRFALQVVTKARKGKPKTRIAKASAKRGKATIVSLKPKARYAKQLARAKKVLVKVTLKTGDTQRTTFRKLKIVR